MDGICSTNRIEEEILAGKPKVEDIWKNTCEDGIILK